MSVYDILPKGNQVKLWNCEMITKRIGDSVPNLGPEEYIVLLRRGGYVHVKNDIITEIKEDEVNYYPEDFNGMICFDKWGKIINSRDDLVGIFHGLAGMNDPYYFRSK